MRRPSPFSYLATAAHAPTPNGFSGPEWKLEAALTPLAQRVVRLVQNTAFPQALLLSPYKPHQQNEAEDDDYPSCRWTCRVQGLCDDVGVFRGVWGKRS